MSINFFLQTGQTSCHDTVGREVICSGSGQDAEFSRGLAWPAPRFEVVKKPDTSGSVTDLLTGFVWTRDANPGEFPMNWKEAHEFVSHMNRDQVHGFEDWRLPNRRELRSLISHQTRNPALPEGYPFKNVFPGWYWSATAAAINNAFAWYVHMEGGRVFYGAKSQYYLVWPVRGVGNGVLPATGRADDSPFGLVWPEPRFETADGAGEVVHDRLTGLTWRRAADLTGEPVLWEEALEAVCRLNANDTGPLVNAERSGAKEPRGGTSSWRLPNINELESLVDMSRHDPALPAGHPFKSCREVYWSSTTSMFEPDWAWALYMNKGAVGVGRKGYARFRVWAVCG